MTNEQLIRQYYDGAEAALEKLYHKNIGLILSLIHILPFAGRACCLSKRCTCSHSCFPMITGKNPS